jgi:cephalosporin hydroxylase
VRKAKIYIDVGINENLLREFLQHLQNFNAKHKTEMHANISMAAPWMSQGEILAMFRSLTPGLPFEKVIPRGSMTEEQKRAMDEFLKEPQ